MESNQLFFFVAHVFVLEGFFNFYLIWELHFTLGVGPWNGFPTPAVRRRIPTQVWRLHGESMINTTKPVKPGVPPGTGRRVSGGFNGASETRTKFWMLGISSLLAWNSFLFWPFFVTFFLRQVPSDLQLIFINHELNRHGLWSLQLRCCHLEKSGVKRPETLRV